MREWSHLGPGVRVWRGNVGAVALHATRPWIARSSGAQTEVLDVDEGRILASWDEAPGDDRCNVWCGDRLVTTSLVEGEVVVRSRLLPDGGVVAGARWDEAHGVFPPQRSARGDVLFVPGKDPSWPTCGHGAWLDAETLAIMDARRFVEEPGAEWAVRDRQLVELHPDGDRVAVVEESLETHDWRLTTYGEGPTLVCDALQPTNYEGATRTQWLHAGAVLLAIERDEGPALVEDLFCFVSDGSVWRPRAIRDASGGSVFRWAADAHGDTIVAGYYAEATDVYGWCVHATRDGSVLAARPWDPAWGELQELRWDPQGRAVAIARTNEPAAFLLVRWDVARDQIAIEELPGLDPEDTPYPIGTLGPALVLSTDRTGLLLCD